MDTATQSLEVQYRELFGKNPDRRWGEGRLLEEVIGERNRRMQQELRKQEEERKAAELALTRQARAQRRGTFEEFTDRAYKIEGDDDEKRLAYSARRVVGAEEAFKIRIKDFSEKAIKYPSYAMQWSLDLYEMAAHAEMEKLVRYYVEEGRTAAELREALTQTVISGASNPARSTSPTSNLMEQEKLAAAAKLLRDL